MTDDEFRVESLERIDQGICNQQDEHDIRDRALAARPQIIDR